MATHLPHQQRVIDEKTELDDKIVKLVAFISHNPIFGKQSPAEQLRLQRQLQVMIQYSDILEERIKDF